MNRPQFTHPELNSIIPNMNKFIDLQKKQRKTASHEINQDSQSFQPQYHQIKKLGFKINKSKLSIGGWSSHQNRVYLQFMIDNLTDFSTEKQRRKTKVFYRLSKILKKRTPDQCRSHHQKLQLKHGDDLYAIMSQINKKIQTCMVQEYVDKQHMEYLDNLQKIRKQASQKIQSTKKDEKINENFYTIELSDNNSIRLIINEVAIASW